MARHCLIQDAARSALLSKASPDRLTAQRAEREAAVRARMITQLPKAIPVCDQLSTDGIVPAMLSEAQKRGMRPAHRHCDFTRAPVLPQLTVPLLVLRGEHDLVPWRQVEQTAKAVINSPRVDLILGTAELGGALHVSSDNFESGADIIYDWLAEILSGLPPVALTSVKQATSSETD